MDIKPIGKKGDKVSFLVKGVSPAFLNSVRRTAMEEVPVMAIEDVEFRSNNSVLYDEMIGLRLGLIPFETDLKSYNLPSECKCNGEGCARCQLKMTLKAKGPGIVYASQIKTKDPKVKPVYPKIPIVSLLDGQEVEVEATAVLGKGKVHAKWCPGLVYYQNVPVIKVLKDDEASRIVDSLPKQKILEKKGNKVVVNDDELMSDPSFAELVEGMSKSIEVTYEEDNFIVTIESWGQLTPKEIMNSVCEIMEAKLENFVKLVKESDK